MAALGKVVLVAMTIVALSSMGGAMLYAVWFLVPLHWLAARGSNGFATGGWALLSGLSVFQAGWMLLWIATDDAGWSLAGGCILALAALWAFVQAAADRAVGRRPLAG